MIHPIVSKIEALLKQKGFWYAKFEHEPVRTSEEAAKIRLGYSMEEGAKAIVLRVDGDKYVMLVLPGDKRFDSKKVKALLGAKNVTFATPEKVEDLTGGVKVGGVPPFGNLFDLEVIADPLVFENERIIFNAGDRRVSIGMQSEDFRALVSPKVRDIVQLPL